ncbi:hypothetical protein [Burkholderia ambifaria]|uniref:hypothetical protein n=1 Tax=Burkholderia ambifaria TaxID=152480 RepID=UPI00158D7324|nr:hypothetical protein [Burkholderia ambifaria]
MSWHHGDWLAFAQAGAGVIAIFGAFGVALTQHWLHARHTDRVEKWDRLRDRYRASTYAEALLQNAIDCAVPILNAIEIARQHRTVNGNYVFDSSRLEKASDALGQAIHNELPTEITNAVLSAWMASQQLSHALRRTEAVETMNLTELQSHCQDHFSVLHSSLEVIRLSKGKWGKGLSEE